MEAADSAENRIVDDRSIEDKITGLKQKLSELKALEVKVNEAPDKQLSTIDPDSRLLKTQGMTRAVCYNVQTAVDTKNHLIVAHEVINSTDRGQLCRVGKQAQATLDNKGVTVIAASVSCFINGIKIPSLPVKSFPACKPFRASSKLNGLDMGHSLMLVH